MRNIWKAATIAALVALTACGKQEPAAAKTYDLSANANNTFLADYAGRKDSVKRQSGLMYRVLKAGTGAPVASPDDMVTVTYKGQLINGKVFDQTKPGKTATFTAGNLIPGWVEALSLMKEGDTWELVIPPELGYGSDGAGDAIPPNETLVFTMTLIKVTPVGAAPAQ